jgi:hypothetical protein
VLRRQQHRRHVGNKEPELIYTISIVDDVVQEVQAQDCIEQYARQWRQYRGHVIVEPNIIHVVLHLISTTLQQTSLAGIILPTISVTDVQPICASDIRERAYVGGIILQAASRSIVRHDVSHDEVFPSARHFFTDIRPLMHSPTPA